MKYVLVGSEKSICFFVLSQFKSVRELFNCVDETPLYISLFLTHKKYEIIDNYYM